MTQKIISFANKLCKSIGENILKYLLNMTVKEQIEAIYGYDYIFHFPCSILVPRKSNRSNETYIKCDDISPIKISINAFSLCFTFFSQTDGQIDDWYVIDYTLSKFEDFSDEIIFMEINSNIS